MRSVGRAMAYLGAVVLAAAVAGVPVVLVTVVTPACTGPLHRQWAVEDLRTAAMLGHTAKVRALVDADPGIVNCADPLGWTPLHEAARTGEIATARLLLDRGARLDAVNEDGATPLHVAERAQEPEMARFLRAAEARAATESVARSR